MEVLVLARKKASRKKREGGPLKVAGMLAATVRERARGLTGEREPLQGKNGLT